jgi:hypothetical protein
MVASALLMGGALSARFAIFRAGFASAADPEYVVSSQRQAERRTASR